jgi:hypothetical protein
LRVRVDLSALCVSQEVDYWSDPRYLLPCKAAAEQDAMSPTIATFLKECTAMMAAAVSEYALAAGPAGPLDEFDLHVAAAAAATPVDLNEASSNVVARALRNWDHCLEVCRALLVH